MGPWDDIKPEGPTPDEKIAALKSSMSHCYDGPTLGSRLSKTFWTGVCATILALATPFIMA